MYSLGDTRHIYCIFGDCTKHKSLAAIGVWEKFKEGALKKWDGYSLSLISGYEIFLRGKKHVQKKICFVSGGGGGEGGISAHGRYYMRHSS